MQKPDYDFIVAGGGAAGLSLLVRMLDNSFFNNHRILLIDRETKSGNDKTWCFWEQGEGLFESLVEHSWNKLNFYGSDFSKQLNINPYRYKMIRSGSFYDYCYKKIKQNPQVEIITTEILNIENKINGASVKTTHGEHSTSIVFSSIGINNVITEGRYKLLQHFKGYFIETTKPVFDKDSATLMDFRIDQEGETRFVYILPRSSTEALVEFTVFSKNLLHEEVYDAELRNYIQTYITKNEYRITDKEFGVIPMNDNVYKRKDGNIIFTGTAGGATKASTGYTFQFIQRNNKTIIDGLVQNRIDMLSNYDYSRFSFYDAVLLRLLYNGEVNAKAIFTTLFKNNNPSTVLAFLGNQSTLPDEIGMFVKLPVLKFGKAALTIASEKLLK